MFLRLRLFILITYSVFLQNLFALSIELGEVAKENNSYRYSSSYQEILNKELISAVMSNDYRRTIRLLEEGSQVIPMGPFGITAVHQAVLYASSDIIHALIAKYPATVNAKTKYDAETPLHWAARIGSKRSLSIFLENGADINARDKYGRTALFLACNDSRTEAICFLLVAGADTKIPNHRRVFPFHICTSYNKLFWLFYSKS